jgi:hypothetical protein
MLVIDLETVELQDNAKALQVMVAGASVPIAATLATHP